MTCNKGEEKQYLPVNMHGAFLNYESLITIHTSANFHYSTGDEVKTQFVLGHVMLVLSVVLGHFMLVLGVSQCLGIPLYIGDGVAMSRKTL